ncbi:MAG: HlyD family efflux transporter periplasmic adaptor subunit [Phycisphaerales bacterium]|nr:MAG: HlyD family efflux transporter periplasmic adaptor subunit [Phycisphaerales bacterium]
MNRPSQEQDAHQPSESGSAGAARPPRGRPADVEHLPIAPSGLRGVIANLAAPLLFVIAAAGVGAVLISSPPHVPKAEPETLAPVVGVADLVPHDTEVFLEAFGSVVPSRQVRVMPEVSGRVLEHNDRLEPGGLIAAGEPLIRIDPADYQIAVAQAQADLDVATHEAARIGARIETLHGRRAQLSVEVEYLRWNAQRLGRLAERDSAGEQESRDAVTQLESREAARKTLDAEIAEQRLAVQSAEAAVAVAEQRLEAARLALERTSVFAPFDAIVVTENVETGQFVAAQTSIATLAATDEFWAEAAIPIGRLGDIRFALDDEGDASRVTVTLATGGAAVEWEGVALRPLGDLDPLGRMAQVLISIRDPLGLNEGTSGAARRVLLGSFVKLRIDAGRLHGVFPIPRKALRENDRVWVRTAEGRLAIRPVEIVWRRHEDVLVRNGFQPGDQLVTTHLASVIPDMPLRVRDGGAGSAIAAADGAGAAAGAEADPASGPDPAGITP